MTLYPEDQTTPVIERMLPLQAMPVPPLSQETGIPQDTRYGWRRQACRACGLPLMGSTHLKERWSSAEQFARVVETAALNEAQRGEYCRKRGLYPEQLQGWRQCCEQANGGQGIPRATSGAGTDARRVQESARRTAFSVQV